MHGGKEFFRTGFYTGEYEKKSQICLVVNQTSRNPKHFKMNLKLLVIFRTALFLVLYALLVDGRGIVITEARVSIDSDQLSSSDLTNFFSKNRGSSDEKCDSQYISVERNSSEESYGHITIVDPDRNETRVKVVMTVASHNYVVNFILIILIKNFFNINDTSINTNKIHSKFSQYATKRSKGGLSLVKSLDDSARDVDYGRPLLLTLKFPIQNPLPKISEIYFNNRLLCQNRDGRSIVDIITFRKKNLLNYSLFPHLTGQYKYVAAIVSYYITFTTNLPDEKPESDWPGSSTNSKLLVETTTTSERIQPSNIV